MIEIRLALLGLGNVAQAFIKLLGRKIEFINRHEVTVTLVGVATQNHGIAINPGGLDTGRLIAAYRAGQSLEKFHTDSRVPDTLEFISRVEADILIDCTPLNLNAGQPAVDHIATALLRGMHVVTANKSAPAFAYKNLRNIARQQDIAFLFEGTVLAGIPIFSFVRQLLPATEIIGFRGAINSTTNFILTAMEEGLSQEDGLRQAQALGIPEHDPNYDLDGWDAAAKTAILANVLLGANLTPPEVERTGIRHLTTRTVIEAVRQGRRFKLLAEAQRHHDIVTTRVCPRMLPFTNPLANVSGSAAALTLLTDTMGEITLHLSEGEVSQTAYALLADLISVIQSYYASPEQS
jgi:homoserine dehydrogenase